MTRRNVCITVCRHVCLFMYVSVCMVVFMHVICSASVCQCIYMCACMWFLFMYACMCVYVNMNCISVSVSACNIVCVSLLYIYIYIYTHTHTHTYMCAYVCKILSHFWDLRIQNFKSAGSPLPNLVYPQIFPIRAIKHLFLTRPVIERLNPFPTWTDPSQALT